jgi:DNA-binding NarL/FixJ family response regulator
MVKVLVVEDHPIYRDGLAALLGSADIEVVGLATSGADALALLNTDPDVVVMDIGLPDRDGAELTAEVLSRRPDTRVLILTMFHDDSAIARALEAGASGYLVKDAPPDHVLRAVASVASGTLVFGSEVAPRVRAMTSAAVRRGPTPPSEAFPELRERERQVLGMIAQGLDNAAIAERLGLSGKTVANYVSTILTHLRVRDRAAAAQLVQQRTARS